MRTAYIRNLNGTIGIVIVAITCPFNAKRIQTRAADILALEAPISRDLLIRRTYWSFGTQKTPAVLEATEKALNSVKIKSNKQNGIAFCWLKEQEPDSYTVIRGGESSKNARQPSDICQQEMKNAVCYTLSIKGSMDKASLIKETSRVLGYARITETISFSIEIGIRYAKKIGAITIDRDICSLIRSCRVICPCARTVLILPLTNRYALYLRCQSLLLDYGINSNQYLKKPRFKQYRDVALEKLRE